MRTFRSACTDSKPVSAQNGRDRFVNCKSTNCDHKPPQRLNGVDYCGFHRYFLTICTTRRRTIFDSSNAVDPVLEKLFKTAGSNGFSLPAYCAGITKELGEYPFCGSDRYQLSDIIDVWQGSSRT